jgi:hypothetical protein
MLALSGAPAAGSSSWSSAYIYDTASGRRLFVKTALGRDPASMFQGEAEGLRAMHGGSVRAALSRTHRVGSLPSVGAGQEV